VANAVSGSREAIRRSEARICRNNGPAIAENLVPYRVTTRHAPPCVSARSRRRDQQSCADSSAPSVASQQVRRAGWSGTRNDDAAASLEARTHEPFQLRLTIMECAMRASQEGAVVPMPRQRNLPRPFAAPRQGTGRPSDLATSEQGYWPSRSLLLP
jgi:hypothetical protein